MATKWIKIGQITQSKDEKTGSMYKKLVLNKEFLADAKNLTGQAFLTKQEGRSFPIFDAKPSKDGKPAPDWLLGEICVKVEE